MCKNILIVLIVLLTIGQFIYGCDIAHENDYDSFGFCKLKLSVSKTEYVVGDTIELNFEIIPTKKKKIRLFEEKWKSLGLHVYLYNEGSAGPNHPIASMYNFVTGERRITGLEKIEEIEIDQDNPYRLTIKGAILRNKENGYIVFDFPDFGKLEILRQASIYEIEGYWRPINPSPLDSLEDFTDRVKISIKNF